MVTDILGDRLARCHRSARDYDKSDEEAVWILAERIAAEVDTLVATVPQEPAPEASSAASCGCACGSAPPNGNLKINGQTVRVNGLPLIFAHLYKQGLRPGDGCANQLLETARIYHEVQPGENELYRDALADAYQQYCHRQP